jgi:hypothetical protein
MLTVDDAVYGPETPERVVERLQGLLEVLREQG